MVVAKNQRLIPTGYAEQERALKERYYDIPWNYKDYTADSTTDEEHLHRGPKIQQPGPMGKICP